MLLAVVGYFLYKEFAKPVIKELAKKRAEKKEQMQLLEHRLDVLDAKQELIRQALEASERITSEALNELNKQRLAERNRRIIDARRKN